jgi:hypothetical protein
MLQDMNAVNELAEQKAHLGGLTERDVDVCESGRSLFIAIVCHRLSYPEKPMKPLL